jgi:hypothetical protein
VRIQRGWRPFWSQLLDMTVTGEHGDGTGWATVGSRLDDRPRLTFQQVAEPKTAKVRIHLDVQVDGIATARKQGSARAGEPAELALIAHARASRSAAPQQPCPRAGPDGGHRTPERGQRGCRLTGTAAHLEN